MAMTSSHPPTNPLKRKMEAPAYPPGRNSPATNGDINHLNSNSPNNLTNRRSSNTSIRNSSNNLTANRPTGDIILDRAGSVLDRTGPNGRKSIPPAFAFGKGDQKGREMPPAYIMATSPVEIQGDYKRTRLLPLSLILMIVGFVSQVLFLICVVGRDEGMRGDWGIETRKRIGKSWRIGLAHGTRGDEETAEEKSKTRDLDCGIVKTYDNGFTNNRYSSTT